MTFKIICAGWHCSYEQVHQTLASIQKQTVQDFKVCMAYCSTGPNDPGEQAILKWKSLFPENYLVFIRDERVLDTQNRYQAIEALDPKDDDVIIFLDIDGDELAHPEVLEHLLEYYSDGTLTTYGSYESKPFDPGCSPAREYPAEVVARRSYRAFGNVYFNHLRTMKGRIFNNIPISEFRWPDGSWYTKGCDVQFTLCALELAGNRFKVIPEVLMYYKSDNPLANWRIAPEESNACNIDFMRRPPLGVLP